jgi:glycosyltransferase involved in cell wall biosynthesis
LAHIDTIRNPAHKYARGLLATWTALHRLKPDPVFAQNPSLVLCVFLSAYKILARCRLIVDAHNAGLFPLENRVRALRWLAALVQRRADLTIVSNPTLADHVAQVGGRPFSLPDPIPELPVAAARQLPGAETLLFICTFAADEPFEAVFSAARLLDAETRIYVTGNYRKGGIDPSRLPPNVILTGHVPESEYVQMLHAVDGTIDLTTRENCLVCGAYESIAAGKPMILSRTAALQAYFNRGAVYTDNSAADIARCILELLRHRERLGKEIAELRRHREAEWQRQAAGLQAMIFGGRCEPSPAAARASTRAAG